MPRVRFTDDFDYLPKRHVVIAYKAGHVLPVKQDCADRAIAEGKAEQIGKPKAPKPEADPQ